MFVFCWYCYTSVFEYGTSIDIPYLKNTFIKGECISSAIPATLYKHFVFKLEESQVPEFNLCFLKKGLLQLIIFLF